MTILQAVEETAKRTEQRDRWAFRMRMVSLLAVVLSGVAGAVGNEPIAMRMMLLAIWAILSAIYDRLV